MRRVGWSFPWVLGAISLLGVGASCTLNPQAEPPGFEEGPENRNDGKPTAGTPPIVYPRGGIGTPSVPVSGACGGSHALASEDPDDNDSVIIPGTGSFGEAGSANTSGGGLKGGAGGASRPGPDLSTEDAGEIGGMDDGGKPREGGVDAAVRDAGLRHDASTGGSWPGSGHDGGGCCPDTTDDASKPHICVGDRSDCDAQVGSCNDGDTGRHEGGICIDPDDFLDGAALRDGSPDAGHHSGGSGQGYVVDGSASGDEDLDEDPGQQAGESFQTTEHAPEDAGVPWPRRR